MFKKALLPVVVASIFLGGCGGSDSSSTSTPPVQPVVKTTLTGKVIDKETLLPIANAVVKVNDKSVSTNSEGAYSLSDLPVGSTNIIIIANGYFTQAINQNFQPTPNSLDFNLVKADASVESNTTQEIKITNNNAMLTIPANSLVRKDGQAIVGKANVQIAVIESAQEPENMPGGYQIVGGGWMDSYGAILMTVRDDSGAELALSNGKTATVNIQVSSRNKDLPNTIPLFYYDLAQNGWVQSGTATLVRLSNGEFVYQGTINRIAPWNADQVMQTITLNGCVKDTEGNEIANAIVSGDGIDYSSITKVSTDAQGKFSLPVKTSSNLYVLAQSGNKTSNAQKIMTTASAQTMSQCLIVSSQNNSLTMRLTWGQYPEDVDSHLITPNGSHIYYSNDGSLTSEPFANLDVDDITSFGPEVVTVRRLQVGTYRYGLHNYSNTLIPTNMKQSPVRVELEGAKLQKRIIYPTLADSNNLFWYGFDLVVDAQCNVTYKPIDQWLANDDNFTALSPQYNSNPQYCTAP